MTELDWHKCTVKEEEGGGYTFILDVSPGQRSDQAAEYRGQALVRTGREAWNWWARSIPREKGQKWKGRHILGETDSKDEAIEDGLKALDDLIKEVEVLEESIEIRRK